MDLFANNTKRPNNCLPFRENFRGFRQEWEGFLEGFGQRIGGPGVKAQTVRADGPGGEVTKLDKVLAG